jgi:glycosyltransferase involved in cell wall biosynthesis
VGRLPTGIDRVCLAYLEHFGPVSQAVVQHRHYRRILDRPASTALFDLLAEPQTRFRLHLVRGALRLGGRQACNGKGRPYLNVGHTGLDDPGFRQWVTAADVRPVYFVHDLIPLTHPEYCRPRERDRHESRMKTVLKTGTGVIANSRQTLDDLRRFAASEGLPCPPGIAAWLGTTPFPRPAVSHPPDRPTFVTVGTIEGRKNHLFLLQLWTRIVEKLGEAAPRLVVIGQRGWESEQAADLLDRSEKLKGAVIEIGACDDRTLAEHLAGARALLFPSLAEGFGMPALEALQVGTPVIASDLPVFREIGQGVPELLDPLDGPAWERAILAYALSDSPARRAQCSRLANFRPPTWQDHFAKVDTWLASL